MTKKIQAWDKILQGLLVGAAGLVFGSSLWFTGLLQPWEALTWDVRVKALAGPGSATDRIVLVLLDQNSLDWAKKQMGLSWPWPRELYGAFLNFCARGEAAGVALDVLFTEPSSYGVHDDQALGEGLKENGKVAAAFFLSRESGEAEDMPEDFPGQVPALQDMGAPTNIPLSKYIYPRAAMPIQEVYLNARLLGNVNLSPDPDSIYRRARPYALFDGRVFPFLGFAPYLIAHPKTLVQVQPDLITTPNLTIPMDKNGQAILNYRGAVNTYAVLSAAAVIQSEIRLMNGETPGIKPGELKDKYVFFGFSAPGLYDLRPSPVSGVYPGVAIHATFLDNLLSNDFIRDVPTWAILVLTAVLALSCGLAVRGMKGSFRIIFFSVLFLLLPAVFCVLAYLSGYWLNFMVQETSLAGTIVLGLVVNYATEGRQKRFIKNAFGQYLSPKVIDQLVAHPEKLALGGDRRTLSIFFSDIQGFTSISEGLSPEDLTALLNDYLTAMTDIIHEEDGTVDKYEGDAIIAFWNAPLEVEDHAHRAVRAALRCQEKLAQMRPEFKERIGKDMFMRVGINTGPAVVGNMGSHTRFDYTMLGDAVNLAARLEGTNKQFNTYTMISQATKELLPDEAFCFRELARVAVVGRAEPVTVFEPMDCGEYEKRTHILTTFDKGLQLFYQGDMTRARQVFEKIAGEDPAAAAYVQKCDELSDISLEEWRGVWVMTTK